MDQATYLKERIDDQIKWYDKKSGDNQRKFKRSKTIIITVSVLVPLLSGFISDAIWWLKYVVGGLGALIAILEGYLGLQKYQENWIQYRGTAESLKREKILFLTKSGGYQKAQTPFNLFVMNAETIMDGEHSNWQQYIKKDDDA